MLPNSIAARKLICNELLGVHSSFMCCTERLLIRVLDFPLPPGMLSGMRSIWRLFW